MVSSFFFDCFQHVPFSTVSRAEGGGGLLARALRPQAAVKRHEDLHNLGELMLTTALRPSSDCKLSSPSSVTQSTSSPRSLHEHSFSYRACATFVLNDVLSSTRLKPFLLQPNCFHTSGSRHRSRFSRWLHWS